jgi:hypothetical protein
MGKVVKKVVTAVANTVVFVATAVVKVTTAVVGVVIDVVVAVAQVVVDVVVFVWNEIVLPALEEIFSWIGIKDQTLVQAEKVSIKLLNGSDPLELRKAKARALMIWLKEENSLWKVIARELSINREQVKSYYNYADKGKYIYGMPTVSIVGNNLNKNAVASAVSTENPGGVNVVWSSAMIPNGEMFYKHEYQKPPYNYKPTSNILSHPDEWGNWHNDWTLEKTSLELDPAGYKIRLTRQAERALFWLEGPLTITEGGTVELVVKCNRVVPEGRSVTVSFEYSGDMLPEEYSAPLSVTIGEGASSATVSIEIFEDLVEEPTETLVTTIVSIDNNGSFGMVGNGLKFTHNLNVVDNDSLSLVMDSAVVGSSATSVTIPVTLTQATLEPFTVDYSFADDTTIGGVDYDNTPGQLSFEGLEGEVQHIEVTLTPDLIPGSSETFMVVLSNPTQPVYSGTIAYVTIVDGTANPHTPDTSRYIYEVMRPDIANNRKVMARYEKLSEPGEFYYWMYNPEDGTYPGISASSSEIQTNEVLPITILRSDRVTINSDKTSELYKSTKGLAKRLGIPLDDVIESIEATKNEKGESNLEQINDVYLNFAVSPSDNSPALSKILWYNFFEIIVTNGLVSDGSYYSVLTQQEVSETLVWADHSYVAGVVGVKAPVGKHYHSIVVTSESYQVDETDSEGNVTTVTKTREVKSLEIGHQVTAGAYNKLFLKGLSGASFIDYGSHHMSVFHALDSDKFTIPISWYAFQQLTKEDVTACFKDILRCDIYALVVTEIAWYQTKAFQNLVKVVGLFMTIITLGGTGSLFAALLVLGSQYLVMKLVIYIAEITGNEVLAAIVGIVALVVLGSAIGFAPIDFTTADGLVKLVTDFSSLYATAGNVVLEGLSQELNALASDYEAIEKDREEIPQSLIASGDMAYILSAGATMTMGVTAQYDYDAAVGGNYDRLVSDFYENILRIGIV